MRHNAPNQTPKPDNLWRQRPVFHRSGANGRFVTGDSGAAVLVLADRVHTLASAPWAPGHHGGSGPAEPPDAVLVRGGRVLAAGARRALRDAHPGASVLDLAGTVITPGLTDAHVHLAEWAMARSGVDLRGAGSAHDAARRVAAAAGDGAAGWIRGRGWSAGAWPDAPARDLLDAVSPDRPVLLQSHDMHSLWLNGAALAAAGIGDDTPDPPGGRIERDERGRATGILRENAMPLALEAMPAPSAAERERHVLEAQSALHRMGVTGVHTVEPDSLALLEAIRASGRLRLRILQHLPLARLDDALRIGLRSGFGGEWLRIGGVKMFLDGALGSRTAWLRSPYEGSDDVGVSTLPPETFRDVVARGAAGGLAMTVHAIGDAAVDLALDVLGGTEGARLTGPVPHRIEHVQLVGPDRLRDAGAAGIVCSMQPQHLMTDWPAIDRDWGERGRTAFPFRSLADGGAVLAFGSDAPVEEPDPRLGLYAAVARRDLGGAPERGWHPGEAVSALEALAGYTTGAARAAGDPRQGRLAPGCFADLVAWDADPLAVEPRALPKLGCVMTMVGGETVWRES